MGSIRTTVSETSIEVPSVTSVPFRRPVLPPPTAGPGVPVMAPPHMYPMYIPPPSYQPPPSTTVRSEAGSSTVSWYATPEGFYRLREITSLPLEVQRRLDEQKRQEEEMSEASDYERIHECDALLERNRAKRSLWTRWLCC